MAAAGWLLAEPPAVCLLEFQVQYLGEAVATVAGEARSGRRRKERLSSYAVEAGPRPIRHEHSHERRAFFFLPPDRSRAMRSSQVAI
ncbi:hypothetical protein CLOP_g14482 [Closterium sp. NIES-67]|nr:hypothetical protein CLOP_g14482 [Closterium sp. NIES-67]